MKLKIVSLFASLLVLLNLVVAGTAQAQILSQASPAKPDLTTLTPEEKTDFFSKIKDFFKPTPEEIGEKIKMKDKFKPTPEEIGEKIKTGRKMKEKFKPAVDDAAEAIEGAKPKLTPDEIVEKIKTSMKTKPSADEIVEKIKAKAAAAAEAAKDAIAE